MKDDVVVVGSGASGVHFALTALKRGFRVTMLDVGYAAEPPALPTASFRRLRAELGDPVDYFLGPRFEAFVSPEHDTEYYGFPPNKNYVFQRPDGFSVDSDGFAPLFSFGQGGLAQAWTAGCYPLNDHELAEFPLCYEQLEPYYVEVARRIGITGQRDDLAQFLPVHDGLLEPLPLDPHSARLLEAYAGRREVLNKRFGAYLGRTRVAVLSAPRDGRAACHYLGRCLWGCPIDALYTPSATLAECRGYSQFTYLPGQRAKFFRTDGTGRITGLVAEAVDTSERHELPVGQLALAAGTLSSALIVLRSVWEATGRVMRLPGLMDNRQILVPFLTFRMLGSRYDDQVYQYHLLGMGLAQEQPDEYVHCQITTLHAALMHPIVQRLPVDLRTAAAMGRLVHAALGVVNVNLHDTRRPDNVVTLTVGRGEEPRLRVRYRPPEGEAGRLRRIIGQVKGVLRRLGCFAPPGMEYVRPMGASVHYAGTFPMSELNEPWTTTPQGRSRDFPNLLLVDGSSFPFLPAKNLTFTMMANAVRVATEAL